MTTRPTQPPPLRQVITPPPADPPTPRLRLEFPAVVMAVAWLLFVWQVAATAWVVIELLPNQWTTSSKRK